MNFPAVFVKLGFKLIGGYSNHTVAEFRAVVAEVAGFVLENKAGKGCAGAGERWEILKDGAPVCVTAVSAATLLPNEFTTAYRSAMFKGRAQVVTDEGEKTKAMLLLCTAFDPKGMARFDEAMSRCTAQVIKIVPETITGKEHEMQREPKSHGCKGE